MIWVFLGLAVVLLAILEHFWGPYALEVLHFEGRTDREIAEPGQVITWSGTVENQGRLPIPFVRLMERFPYRTKVHEDPLWMNSHWNQSVTQGYVEEKLILKPLQRATRTVRISFPRRGRYELGAYQLSAGDLLGFRETKKTGDGTSVVVIPERSKKRKKLEALGGFLGDVSVRRFILEDPILTVGFRDYTGREPLKSISWTRTASAGKLQVKQFDHTAEQHIMILLNVEGASEEELEECFRLVRTACEDLEKKKIPYGFRTNGNLPGPVGKVFFMAEGLGARHVNTILYGLGTADGTCFYSFRHLTNQTLNHRKGNESYILVTPPLTEHSRACVRRLEQAVGNGICVLTADTEVTEA